MTQQRLAFALGEKPRLELDWGTYMRDFEVRLDGKEIGRIEGGQRALKQPHTFALPDGSELSIRLKQNQLVDELEVLRDGVPLPGSASSPLSKISAAIRYSFIWGIICICGWLVAWYTDSLIEVRLTFSPYSIVFGVALLFLSYRMSKRSAIAAYLAPIVFVAGWVLSLYLASQAEISFNFINTIGNLARFMSLVPLIQGALAFRALPQRSAE